MRRVITQPYTNRQITCRGKQFVFIVNSFFCLSISSLEKDQLKSIYIKPNRIHVDNLACTHRGRRRRRRQRCL